jgi:hypothetical protein
MTAMNYARAARQTAANWDYQHGIDRWSGSGAKKAKKKKIKWYRKDHLTDDIMPYGKYKGLSVKRLPQHYLDWMVVNTNDQLPLIKILDREWLRRYNLKKKSK